MKDKQEKGIEKFIRLAIEGGWDRDSVFNNTFLQAGYRPIQIDSILLDPEAWKAVGKSMRWSEEVCPMCGNDNVPDLHCEECGHHVGDKIWTPEELFKQHQMIDHLAQGKDIESYLNSLFE